ncbi:hypothetical protein [Rhizobium sp. HT1-10]|uniref:hypothetical protein n=1 Tax=Rhizobium sp. HT1-10 TaxID=3111638 RepID=UPI003C218429
MKSPWKLFAKLTSRRQPQTAEGAAVEIARAPEAAEQETLRVPQLIGETQPSPVLDESSQNDLLATTAIPPGDRDGSFPADLPITVEDVQESAALENKPSSDEMGASVEPVLRSTRSAKSPRTKQGNSAKKNKPEAGLRMDVDDATPALVAEPASEAITLDNEIKELRQQLAMRLRMQNDQLKMMIERYDR